MAMIWVFYITDGVLVLAPVRNDRKSAGKTTAGSAGLGVSRHAGAAVGGEAGGDDAARRKGESTRCLPSRAVGRNRSCGKSFLLGVQLDRLDHQVECFDAVHFACHAVGTA